MSEEIENGKKKKKGGGEDLWKDKIGLVFLFLFTFSNEFYSLKTKRDAMLSRSDIFLFFEFYLVS
jgi:hypothetical protein